MVRGRDDNTIGEPGLPAAIVRQERMRNHRGDGAEEHAQANHHQRYHEPARCGRYRHDVAKSDRGERGDREINAVSRS